MRIAVLILIATTLTACNTRSPAYNDEAKKPTLEDPAEDALEESVEGVPSADL